MKKNKGKCRVYPGPFDVELPTEKGTVVVPDAYTFEEEIPSGIFKELKIRMAELDILSV